MFNRSIAGSSTGDSLQRFARDVPPLRPDFVILATAITNEYFFQNPAAAKEVYLSNLRQLIGLTEAIGAIPVVAGPNPNAAYDRGLLDTIHRIYAELQGEGVPVWNFVDSLSDDSGRWLPGLSLDGLHPTDAGHALLFESIPLGIFTMEEVNRRYDAAPLAGRWQVQAGLHCDVPMTVRLDRPAASWTAGFEVASNAADSALLWEGAGLQILRSRTELVLLARWEVLAKIENPPAAAHILLVRHGPLRRLSLYLNATLQSEIQNLEVPELSSFTIGSIRGQGRQDAFRQLMFYRAPLDESTVRGFAAGSYASASLDVWLPMNRSTGRPRWNLAGPSNRIEVCDGAWQWIRD